jgi:signal peptidase I
MRDDSGNNPLDPGIVPRRPGQEPLPPNNGLPAEGGQRVAPGMPGAKPSRAASAAVAAPLGTDKKPPEQKDTIREVVETIVFVVVLVLLLKAFLAEAFVIPTGSMATTLLGYHREVVCPECGFRFPVNLSKEMDAQEAHPQRITGCTCPNCRLHIDLTHAPPE